MAQEGESSAPEAIITQTNRPSEPEPRLWPRLLIAAGVATIAALLIVAVTARPNFANFPTETPQNLENDEPTSAAPSPRAKQDPNELVVRVDLEPLARFYAAQIQAELEVCMKCARPGATECDGDKCRLPQAIPELAGETAPPADDAPPGGDDASLQAAPARKDDAAADEATASESDTPPAQTQSTDDNSAPAAPTPDRRANAMRAAPLINIALSSQCPSVEAPKQPMCAGGMCASRPPTSKPCTAYHCTVAPGDEFRPATRSCVHLRGRSVVVRDGDTLWRIAHCNDVSVAHLMAMNHLSDPTRIYPGHTLRVY